MSVLITVAAVAVFSVLFVATVLMIANRPQRGVVLMMLILPFDGLLLLVDLPGFVGGWKEGLTLAIVGATFIAPASARGPVGRPIPSWAAPAMALVALAGIWVARGGPGVLTGFKITCFFLVVPFALWRCPLNAGERDRIVTILMVSSFGVAMIGIAQQIVGPDFLVSLGYEWNSAIRTTKGLLRSISTFEQPFPFAFYVMTALSLCVPVALYDTDRRRNRLYLWASPLIVLGMSTAIVRGAFVGLATAVLVIGIYRYRMLVHLLAPVFIVGILLSGQIGSALFSASSLFERTDRWQFVFEEARDKPFGGGLTTSGAAADALVEAPIKVAETFSLTSSFAAPQPDNYYLKLLLDLGIPGMWLMIMIVYFSLRYAWRVTRSATGADAAMAAGICAALSAAAAAALVSTYWEIFPADLLFWMLLGVLPSLDPNLQRRSVSMPSPSALAEVESRPTSASSSGA